MRLANPIYLLLFVPLLFLIREHLRGRDPAGTGTLRYSDLTVAGDLKETLRVRIKKAPFWFRAVALSLLIFAAARPQYGITSQEVVSKGIDIIICLDQSGSMSGIDLRPGQQEINPGETRIVVAKGVIRDFIKGRRNDRLGLVIFGGRAYTLCPLTLDYGILLTLLDSVGIAERDQSTAIGDAIGTSVAHLKNSDAKSKVIILVTDGESNSGLTYPITAARLAAEFKIKVYTVGVGSHAGTVREVKDFFGSHYVPEPWGLDEATLMEVSRITGARYFPAGDPEAMVDVFHKIDQMEKTEIKTHSYTEYSEHFLPFALLAAVALFVEVSLRNGYLRSIP